MKLSIIMPCFNVEDTLDRALDSVAMQKLDYDYEIIIVDDASTDSTSTLIQARMQSNPKIRHFKNEKNLGNAKTFYRGLCEARGDYFCVLDGDDYYTVSDKLQKQITFLENDRKQEYVAVATHFIIDFGNGRIHIPLRPNRKEFTYVDMLLRQHPYCHTATYMYRNIFKETIPEYFNMPLYRGDTPRTIFHLMYSGKKVHVLDFVGSAYAYTYQGIWSAQDEKSHFQYQIDFYTQHKNYLRTAFEKRCIDNHIELNQELRDDVEDGRMDHYPDGTINDCLKEIERYASIFAFREAEFMFREVFFSEYLDTLLASIGYITRLQNPSYVQSMVNEDSICILISKLNPHGGGIFTEIKELSEMYFDKKVFIIQTFDSDLSDEAITALSATGNHVHVFAPPEDCQDKLGWLSKLIVDISPFRTYCYCSHQDVYSVAAISEGPCENICLFSFDHGFILGLNNPALATIAAKRPVDYQLLSKRFDEELIYLPAWGRAFEKRSTMTTRENRSSIITASGAARFYKVDGERPYRYLDVIKRLIAEAGATHYHFGPLPAEAIDEIRIFLADNSLPQSCFNHIVWSRNIAADMNTYGVDLFIEPFPTVSYKLTLNVLSAGIPIAAWQSLKRMSTADFIPADSIVWHRDDDLIRQVNTLTQERLDDMAENALKYFLNTHEFEKVCTYIRENRTMEVGAPRYIVDDDMHDIADYLGMFEMHDIYVMGYLDRKQALQDHYDHLRKSRSLALGHAILSPFRDSKQSADHTQIIDEFLKLDAAEYIERYGENKTHEDLRSIKSSKEFKLGRALTWPSVVLHKILKTR